MASGAGDPQYVKDQDAAYLALRLETTAYLKAYKAESDLRRAMQIYNKGAAQSQVNFKEAMRKARENQAARARGDTEDLW